MYWYIWRTVQWLIVESINIIEYTDLVPTVIANRIYSLESSTTPSITGPGRWYSATGSGLLSVRLHKRILLDSLSEDAAKHHDPLMSFTHVTLLLLLRSLMYSLQSGVLYFLSSRIACLTHDSISCADTSSMDRRLDGIQSPFETTFRWRMYIQKCLSCDIWLLTILHVCVNRVSTKC